jgi:hypothetical protein
MHKDYLRLKRGLKIRWNLFKWEVLEPIVASLRIEHQIRTEYDKQPDAADFVAELRQSTYVGCCEWRPVVSKHVPYKERLLDSAVFL